MRSASRYFRWFIVASLSLSLVGGGFCSQSVMANCSSDDATHHQHRVAKKCCCGENCKCGAACLSHSAPDKSQQPTKTADRDVRDLVKTAPAVVGIISELPFGQRFSKPASTFCGESNIPQTLIAQHTCLQV